MMAALAALAATATLIVACAPEPAASSKTSVSETPAPTPEPPTPEEVRHAAALEWVEGASTRELVGSVIMASVSGTDAAVLHGLMANAGLGGFIVMGSNVPGTPTELDQLTNALTVDSALPPLVAIDEEGGVVTRLPWDGLPGADSLRNAPEADTKTAFQGRAETLADSGVNVNFGIVADVTSDPLSFIYTRTLGDDPQSAASRVAAAISGERGRVASTLKHFPGHGAVPGDSHYTVPHTDKTLNAWRSSDAVPFEAGIDAGAELLMFGHLTYTQVSAQPASLSPEWYALARGELGFTGVTVTDDLGMLQASGIPEYQDPAANVVAALAAGADIALIIAGMDAQSIVALVDQVTVLVEAGTLPVDRLSEAALRVTELRLMLADADAGEIAAE
ncbi:MAG: glycoside hydrolase family 3 N-terminal domain-containing protein [Leucobacter sp.]